MKEDQRRLEIERYKMDLVEVWTDINQSLPDNVSFYEAKPILLSKLRTIEQKVDEFKLSLDTKDIVQESLEKTDRLVEGQKLTMIALKSD
jgi:hypothetical protein